MRITLEHRNPTPGHCKIAIFVNGALSGIICLRQEEILIFQQIISDGCNVAFDTFLTRGHANYYGIDHYPPSEDK